MSLNRDGRIARPLTAVLFVLLASLWSVRDKPAQVLMARFYEDLWCKDLPPPAALREAQLDMLREGLDRGGLSRLPPARTPPFFWAAFVLSTDRL